MSIFPSERIILSICLLLSVAPFAALLYLLNRAICQDIASMCYSKFVICVSGDAFSVAQNELSANGKSIKELHLGAVLSDICIDHLMSGTELLLIYTCLLQNKNTMEGDCLFQSTF